MTYFRDAMYTKKHYFALFDFFWSKARSCEPNVVIAATLAGVSLLLSTALLVLAVLLITSPAHAHDLNMTGVKVTIAPKSVRVSVLAHRHQLENPDIAAEIGQRLKLRLEGKPFIPHQVQVSLDKSNGIVMWQARSSQNASWLALDAPLFPENTSQSTAFSVIKNRRLWQETVLDATHPSAILGNPPASQTSKTIKPNSSNIAASFFHQGVSHIFQGIDHVLFLLSLLLLGGSWKHLLKIVTAFTLAHSITLSLAATGLVSLPPRFVEPVIALSITTVALLNIRKSFGHRTEHYTPLQRDFRPYMAFGFGLIHGFGFAGALTEVGLPREAIGLALLAFNGGVEAGQMLIVLLFCPALAFLTDIWPKLQQPLVRYGSFSVASVGAFWFVQRLFHL